MTNRLDELACKGIAITDNVAVDQRGSNRIRTVLRTVKVKSPADEGLARLQNISDGGMMLRTGLPVCLGDTITVHLSDDRSVAAQVVWTEGENCGVRFTTHIDSAALLVEMAARTRDGSARPVRLPTDQCGTAYTQGGIHRVRVRDVSQRGMKVEHQSGFAEGVPIKILLASGLERRGIVRWSKGDIAGIQFLEAVSLDRLGSSKHL